MRDTDIKLMGVRVLKSLHKEIKDEANRREMTMAEWMAEAARKHLPRSRRIRVS